MSDSKLSSFAVAGAGNVGLPIIKALAGSTPKPKVVVLSRSQPKEPLPEGVQSVTVDYDDVDKVASVLKEHGVEAIVSTITTVSVAVQTKLADAGKQAGVKVFWASEFGFPTGGAKEGLLALKSQVIDHLKSIGLPYARLYTGYFTEWLPLLVGAHTGKVNIVGSGDVPFSTTALADFAPFVAYALTTFPVSKLQNATYRLEGSRLTLKELAQQFGGLPVESVDKVPSDNPQLSEFSTLLQKWVIDTGKGSVRWDWTEDREFTKEEVKEELGENLWPGHVWQKVQPLKA